MLQEIRLRYDINSLVAPGQVDGSNNTVSGFDNRKADLMQAD
jgi:hypothetical protein